MHRIGNDLPSDANTTRVPVFLMHGLLETASSWIALGPQHSLGKIEMLDACENRNQTTHIPKQLNFNQTIHFVCHFVSSIFTL